MITNDIVIAAFDSTAGTPAGKTITPILPMPFRGRLIRVGLTPTGSCASTMTIAASIWSPEGSAVALPATAVGPANLAEEAQALDVPRGFTAGIDIANKYLSGIEGLQLAVAGGPTSATGATIFAVVRKG